MGRLVDIDEVIRVAENTFPQEDVRKIAWVLCYTPTAYDVEKVVAELESKRYYRELTNYYGDIIGVHNIDTIEIDNAIEIVKRGGVE